ncbi:unnamed protein product [Caenorhabditis bovis]|uniref:NAD-dependent protein deacetylase n=1 Tax=Caenorhabditis bovis TaxID=2654633 RepID=A0A8S1F0A0_9PELO|nr:unnamed protein product [Caenorhabditis bovis]
MSDKEDDGENHRGRPVQNFYNKFVHTIEQALNVVAYGEHSTNGKILASTDLEGIAEYIKRKNPKNVIVMTGAGISTSAGVPDFRSPGTGLYDNLQKYNLPDSQAIFDISFFEQNPEPFFHLAKKLFPKNLKPTPAHHFVKLLDKKGMLKRWYTQNIDTLEFMVGIDDDKIVTAHGSTKTGTCRRCDKKYDIKWMTDKIHDPNILVPRCDVENCDGVVKPDIVFFGESLPRRFFSCSIQDFPNCDLLIIMGTSLVVQPFASLIHEVSENVPRLLINLNEVAKSIAGEAETGLCYAMNSNKRDVFHKSTCDDGVRRLAELLDWEIELGELICEGEVKHKHENAI